MSVSPCAAEVVASTPGGGHLAVTSSVMSARSTSSLSSSTVFPGPGSLPSHPNPRAVTVLDMRRQGCGGQICYLCLRVKRPSCSPQITAPGIRTHDQ